LFEEFNYHIIPFADAYIVYRRIPSSFLRKKAGMNPTPKNWDIRADGLYELRYMYRFPNLGSESTNPEKETVVEFRFDVPTDHFHCSF